MMKRGNIASFMKENMALHHFSLNLQDIKDVGIEREKMNY